MNKLMELAGAWHQGEIQLAPITALLGIKPVEIGTGQALLEMAAGPKHHNAMGTVHGGILCDLADVAIGVAFASVLKSGETFTSVDLHMSYFRSVCESKLFAAAKIIRRGRSTSYGECEITDIEGKLVAKATSTCLILESGKG